MKEKINVLIVEDEGITAENIKQILLKLGYVVNAIVNNATDAVDILIQKKNRYCYYRYKYLW